MVGTFCPKGMKLTGLPRRQTYLSALVGVGLRFHKKRDLAADPVRSPGPTGQAGADKRRRFESAQDERTQKRCHPPSLKLQRDKSACALRGETCELGGR